MTMTTERRNFLKGVSAAAASTAVLAGTQALAQGNPQAAAKAMPYQAKSMPFDPKTITGISEKVLVSHYENNYVGAVKRLNAIGTQLADLDFAKAPNFVINGLKREELVASNCSICTSTPITWTTVRRPRATSTSTWKLFAGTTPQNCTSTIAGKFRALAVVPDHACPDQL